MERQKREENSIIIHFVFYFILTLLLTIYFFNSILGQIMLIEVKKVETRNLYNKIDGIRTTGLNYEDFVETSMGAGSNITINEILKNMTKVFYNQNLINTTKSSYQDFLDKKSKELNSEDKMKIIDKNNAIISKILPPYSDYSIDFPDGALSDFKFINYVESIIETFNFTNSNPIGISRVNLLEDYAINKGQGNTMDSNIYYIPLNLDLRGTKSSMINFLDFIEHVGNINVVGDKINIDSNYSLLSKNRINKVLIGDKFSSNYNIFEHQIIDIDRITFNEYIDGSYQIKGDENFVDFISRTQGKEEYKASVNLYFYVRGEPTYKLVDIINKNLDKYKEALNLVNQALNDASLDGSQHNQALKYNDTLKQLNENVNNIRKNIGNINKLEEYYKSSQNIVMTINPIFTNLKK